MLELLYEIGCEEIPARLLDRAAAGLLERVRKGLDKAGLEHEDLRAWQTPRRLALSGRVAAGQPDKREEMLGPPARIAFDEAGQPTKAALGFAKRFGLDPSALERRETPRGEYLGATVFTKGQESSELLPAILVEATLALPWPKAMRWSDLRQPFIRPIHWIVALLDVEVLPLTLADVASGRASRGHRFHDPEPFEVFGANAWLEGLRARHVEPDPAERRRIVREGAERLAAEVGGAPELDDALLTEVSGLVEWAVPLRGAFEPEYLELPPEVLTTSMKKHQRYIPIRDSEGGLTNHFVVVANAEVDDPAVVVGGNERVLRARLADARFFFDKDLRRPLEAYVPKLAERRFLEGLGTMLDKARRLEASSGERAGLLAKADLATEMVGEFANLQGTMGREYARHAGEPEELCLALFEHWLPRFAGDILPSTDAGRRVSLADKLDSLVGCFAIGLEPTGSADPYALRRQALGVFRILEANPGEEALDALLDRSREVWGEALDCDWPEVRARLMDFFRGRMKATLARDFPTDLCEAALEAGYARPAELVGRLRALTALKQTEGWERLAIAVKRCANIAGDHDASEPDPASFTESAERDLYAMLREIGPLSEAALAEGAYDDALDHLVRLGPSIDGLFEAVMVMSDNPAERTRRLDLVAAVGRAFGRIAAFDKVST